MLCLLVSQVKVQFIVLIIGIFIFEIEVEVEEGSLIFLGEVVECGLSKYQGLRFVDCCCLDVVFMVCEEVCYEDYLVSDWE